MALFDGDDDSNKRGMFVMWHWVIANVAGGMVLFLQPFLVVAKPLFSVLLRLDVLQCAWSGLRCLGDILKVSTGVKCYLLISIDRSCERIQRGLALIARALSLAKREGRRKGQKWLGVEIAPPPWCWHWARERI